MVIQEFAAIPASKLAPLTRPPLGAIAGVEAGVAILAIKPAPTP